MTNAPPWPAPSPPAVPLARDLRFGLVTASAGGVPPSVVSALVAAAAALARERRLALGLGAPSAVGAVVSGASVFTLSSLAVTHQPFINTCGHLYHPAFVCASLTTSLATSAGVFLSVSIFSWASAYAASRSLSKCRIRSAGLSPPINTGRVPSGPARPAAVS